MIRATSDGFIRRLVPTYVIASLGMIGALETLGISMPAVSEARDASPEWLYTVIGVGVLVSPVLWLLAVGLLFQRFGWRAAWAVPCGVGLAAPVLLLVLGLACCLRGDCL